MAKQKKVPTETTVDDSACAYVSALMKEMNEQYGQGIVSSGTDLIDYPRQRIPLSPAFDQAFGGGIPSGSWISLSGQEGCGKTSTLLSFLANCQKPEHGSRPVMVLSAEHRLSPMILQGTRGLILSAPMFTFVESKKGAVLSADMFLEIGLNFIKRCSGGVLAIDSISSLVNPQVMDERLNKADYGSGNKVLSRFCDLAGPIVKGNDCLVAGIVQFYANSTGMGAQWNEKAAKRWKYQADLSIQCKKTSFEYGNGEEEPATGQVQEWLVKKCAFAPPAGKVTSVIRYGVGIDRARECYDMAHAFGLVSSAGAWHTLDFLEGKSELLAGTPYEKNGGVKVQGVKNAVRVLDENPAWLKYLEQSLAPFSETSREG